MSEEQFRTRHWDEDLKPMKQPKRCCELCGDKEDMLIPTTAGNICHFCIESADNEHLNIQRLI